MSEQASNSSARLISRLFVVKLTNDISEADLANEDVGCRSQRFAGSRSHGNLHDPGYLGDDKLHDSQVVENGNNCAEENDGWHDLTKEQHVIQCYVMSCNVTCYAIGYVVLYGMLCSDMLCMF